MKNRLFLFITIILLISITGCRFGGKKGSGRIVDETRDVGKFSKVELGGSYNVDITVGDETSLKIEGDDNLLEYIDTYVRGDKLIIKSKRNLNSKKGIFITITTPVLDEVDASGACEIYIDKIQSETFAIYMSGACSIEAKGEADRLKLELSGAGSVDADRLYAKSVKVGISGASSASVYADEYLDASVSGVGSIDFYGDPDDVDTNVSGIGSINRK